MTGTQQNIQIMMGRVADLSDLLRSTVPFLTWRDERLTRAALHLAIVSSFVLAFAAPFVPWRLVFFVAGESTFFLGHPIVQTFLASLAPYLSASSKERSKLVRKLLEDDALNDEELEMEVVEVQRIEVETRVPGAPVEAAWQVEAVVGGELPSGFRWLGEWEDATPSDGAVDTGALSSHFPSILLSLADTPLARAQKDGPTSTWTAHARRPRSCRARKDRFGRSRGGGDSRAGPSRIRCCESSRCRCWDVTRVVSAHCRDATKGGRRGTIRYSLLSILSPPRLSPTATLSRYPSSPSDPSPS